MEDLIQEWHLYRYSGEGDAQELYPECLSAEGQREAGGFFPYYFGVNQEGDPAFMGMGSEIAVYDKDTGKEQYNLSCLYGYEQRRYYGRYQRQYSGGPGK